MYDAPFSYSHQYHYPNPYYFNEPINNNIIQSNYWTTHDVANGLDFFQSSNGRNKVGLKDYGRKPFVININEATKQNNNYRTALWTGNHLQVTLMSLRAGGRYRFRNSP